MRLIFVISFLLFSLMCQTQTSVSGSIRDDNAPLPSVTVMNSRQSIGLTSDLIGHFTINASLGDTLEFSFIGYITQQHFVRDFSYINILLERNVEEFGEVVVTALGIEKKKKALGYSVGEVDVAGASTNRDANLVNTMQGKIPGVVVTKTSGGPGASSRIVIRGNSSLVNNNQPLIVVDGMPIDNTTVGSGGTWGGIDYGSPIGDINPDDIESMTVLKGPSAAALYGSRALNGVIVITTKQGSVGKKPWRVELGSNTSIERAYILKDFQNEFGAGTNGLFKYNDDGIPFFETNRPSSPTFSSSWGPRLNGQEYVDWNGQTTTFSPQPDNYKDFFKTGITLTNSLSVSHSGKHQGRISYSNLKNRGISPTSEFKRQNLTLSSAFNFEKLVINAKASYILQQGENRVNQSNGDNAARNIILMPRSISNKSLQLFENADGEEQTWYQGWGWIANPYYVLNRNLNYDQRDRIMANLSARYKLSDNLSVMIRGGQDYFDEVRHQRFAYGSFIVNNGQVSGLRQTFVERNIDGLITYSKSLNENFQIEVQAGGNAMHQRRNTTNLSISELLNADGYTVSNALPEHVSILDFLNEKKLNSLYGSALIEYKSYFFAEITGRNDWSSTLPVQNNSYFYPSLSIAYAFTDHLEIDDKVLSFGKIRAAIAEVGKDADPYLLQLLYDSVATYQGDITLFSMHNPFPLVNLKPEIKRSYELGTDLRFFKGRVNVDFTWYWETTRNQILTSSVSPASGFSSAIVNAGEIRNTGIELLLTTTNIERENISWNTVINFNKNNNLVVSLNEESTRQVLGSQWRVDVTATAGLPYGAIWGYGIEKNEAGTPLLNADGTFVRTAEPVYLGHVNPDWRMGITNAVKWRNWSASFLVDIKKGGKLYSASNMYLHGYAGNVTATLDGRDEWYASELARIEAGVDAPTFDSDGNYNATWSPTGGYLVDGEYAEGTSINGENVGGESASININPEDYWSQFANWTNEIHEPFVYDASFVKLREITIGYKFDLKENSKINSLTCSLVGRNLWLIYSGVPNVDPEAAYTNGNGQGVEYATYPIIRSIGFNLSASF